MRTGVWAYRLFPITLDGKNVFWFLKESCVRKTARFADRNQ
jgi:hypothetical protein